MKQKLSILMIGHFGAPFSTENDYAWTYDHLGHDVMRAEESGVDTDTMIEAGLKADLVHYVHSHGVNTPGEKTVQEMLDTFKAKGIPTIGVHLDYWRGLEREKDVGTHPWWHTDYTFTADGGSHEWYREKSINHYYLKAGVVERDVVLGTKRPEFEHDVIFVGSKGYHDEWAYRPKLVNWLQETYGDRFAHYGGDGLGTMRGMALNDLYASAKVVVGDTLCLGFSHPNYYSDRVFETTGRGGFIIHPYIKGIEDDFDLGRELITYDYDDFDGLKGRVDYYIEHNEEREKIRTAGFQRTKHDHTYTLRVKEMLSILEKDGRLS